MHDLARADTLHFSIADFYAWFILCGTSSLVRFCRKNCPISAFMNILPQQLSASHVVLQCWEPNTCAEEVFTVEKSDTNKLH